MIIIKAQMRLNKHSLKSRKNHFYKSLKKKSQINKTEIIKIVNNLIKMKTSSMMNKMNKLLMKMMINMKRMINIKITL